MGGSRTIAVWGHYHGGNLGDELVVGTIIAAIRRRAPDTRIVAISMWPEDTEARHGVETYPISPPDHPGDGRGPLTRLAGAIVGGPRARRAAGILRAVLREPAFVYRAWRTLQNVDTIVVAGSGQLLDEWRGPWLHPYTTFRWAMLARLRRVPMQYASVGAGPIDTALGAFFFRQALRHAAYVSVRDEHSANLLHGIGVDRPLEVCPDIGYGFAAGELPSRRPSEEPTVGLNVMAHQDPRYRPTGDVRRYEAYVRKSAELVRALTAEGLTVRLFSSQPQSDLRVEEDIEALLDGPGLMTSVVDEIDGVDALVRAVQDLDVVVAARFHSVLLPLLLGIPALGLAYNPKTNELLRMVGQPDRCFDIDAFDVDELVRSVNALLREPQDEVGERVAAHRAAVEAQFDTLFGSSGLANRRPDRQEQRPRHQGRGRSEHRGGNERDDEQLGERLEAVRRGDDDQQSERDE